MVFLEKLVSRKTRSLYKGRHLIISLKPGDVVGVREMHSRKEFLIPIALVYEHAVKLAVGFQEDSGWKRK